MINASISIFIAIRRGHIFALVAVVLLAKKFDLNMIMVFLTEIYGSNRIKV